MEDLLKPNRIKIDSFFIDAKLKEELISDSGNNNIREIINYLTEEVKEEIINQKTKRKKTVKHNEALSINQLRKYYDFFLKIYNSNISEDEKKIQLLMLKANSEYSAKRLNTNRFKIFMANRVNLVVATNGVDFKKSIDALKLHFEALVAYYPKS